MMSEGIAYDFRAICELLTAAFNVQSLELFCEERDALRAAVKEWGPGDGLPVRVQKLLRFCQEHGRMVELLAEVAKERPTWYARFEQQIGVAGPRQHGRDIVANPAGVKEPGLSPVGSRVAQPMTKNLDSGLPNWLPAVLLLLMAVAIPVAALFTLTEQIGKNPLRAVEIAVAYEALVFILGFVTKVWQRLEPDLVDIVAGGIRTRAQWLLSGYRHSYLEYLVYRHRDFDVKGLSTQGVFTLELEKVFVELRVARQTAHRASGDPLHSVPLELREGRHVIWDYLRVRRAGHTSLVVIGPPGSGKTTLLKHMTLTLAEDGKRRERVKLLDRLPVLIFLRDHAKMFAGGVEQTEPNPPLAQVVRDSLAKLGGPTPPAGWIERHLQRGRCLVMMDGLDEVADPETRKRLVGWVERQMLACHKNSFVITSRPFGYQSNPISGVALLEVQPFSSQQIRSFVHNWYRANEIMSSQKDDPGVQMKAREGAEDLLARIGNTPALADLAVNPLLLTMIATVHRYRSSLPGRRIELYAEICEVFLGKRQEAKGLTPNLAPTQKQCVLQPLAYYLMSHKQREITAATALEVIQEPLALVSPQTAGTAFIEEIENQSGLLVERESGVYGFAHLTFQEYLAAIHVMEQEVENELVSRVDDGWWHETIRLYAARCDATAIITACLKEDRPSVAALVLAIECQEEGRKVEPNVRVQLEEVLTKGVEDEDPERRRIVAEALLALRLRRLVRLDDDRYADSGLITHAEYQLFLDEQAARGEHYWPDHWTAERFPEGRGYAPAVGVRPSDAVALCDWLTGREGGNWRYRLPKVAELGAPAGSDAPIGYWATTAGGFECVQVDTAQAIVTQAAVERWKDRDRVFLHAPTGGSLAFALDRPLPSEFYGSARGRAIVLARDIAMITEICASLDLARESARHVDFSHNRARSCRLVGGIAADLDSIATIATALARDLAHSQQDVFKNIHSANANSLARDVTRVRSFAVGLATITDRDLDVIAAIDEAVRDLAGGLGRDCSMAHRLARVLANEWPADEREDARVLTLALDFMNGHRHYPIPPRITDYGLSRGHVQKVANDSVFDICLGCLLASIDWPSGSNSAVEYHALRVVAIALSRGSQRDVKRQLHHRVLRWLLRLTSLALAASLWHELQKLPGGPNQLFDRTDGKEHEEKLSRLLDECLQLWTSLSVMEDRVEGVVPAFEAIRIVKERKRGGNIDTSVIVP